LIQFLLSFYFFDTWLFIYIEPREYLDHDSAYFNERKESVLLSHSIASFYKRPLLKGRIVQIVHISTLIS
jgi:hypothetical protein